MTEANPGQTKPTVAEDDVPVASTPTPTDSDPVKSDDPTTSEPGLESNTDVGPSDPISQPTPPLQATEAPTKTPRQSDEGEKHDWEVVNASPTHSPSKDRENESTKVKREREKSANSTFSKDGKIGQKIDGVKKVLKSGVFGGGSSCVSHHGCARGS